MTLRYLDFRRPMRLPFEWITEGTVVTVDGTRKATVTENCPIGEIEHQAQHYVVTFEDGTTERVDTHRVSGVPSPV